MACVYHKLVNYFFFFFEGQLPICSVEGQEFVVEQAVRLLVEASHPETVRVVKQ